MINFDKDFFVGFVGGTIVGATGYKLYEDNASDLKRFVKNPSLKHSAKTSAEPTLEELITQKENLEDMIAEKELAEKEKKVAVK
ncbi:MAG: hypothetical protein ABF804_03770 [Liquorilactobacillus ghanensis]|jgi:hypothetical protein|uniref:Uncharacterized protein n=1 Tax=Liquorilactobacillus ghanensis DSM 18630 TaxID=1423750 RepID=A0A0R1VS58_9LACO|nr:hypothetical protein [Liquorilactobacillus ghanensis]KRM06196.1 hypothetical protein FC89_GL001066 [Liquorilactobacillus ghanensis DSM 18630]